MARTKKPGSDPGRVLTIRVPSPLIDTLELIATAYRKETGELFTVARVAREMIQDGAGFALADLKKKRGAKR